MNSPHLTQWTVPFPSYALEMHSQALQVEPWIPCFYCSLHRLRKNFPDCHSENVLGYPFQPGSKRFQSRVSIVLVLQMDLLMDSHLSILLDRRDSVAMYCKMGDDRICSGIERCRSVRGCARSVCGMERNVIPRVKRMVDGCLTGTGPKMATMRSQHNVSYHYLGSDLQIR